MDKVCFKCGIEKPLDDFYKHPQMLDGHLNKCKECTKKDVSKNYRDNWSHYREYEKERCKRQDRKTNAMEYRRKMRRKNPEKNKAYLRVSRALKNGTLQKLPCQVCGSFKSEAHHPNYEEPLRVIWLCRNHHMMWHGKIPFAERITMPTKTTTYSIGHSRSRP